VKDEWKIPFMVFKKRKLYCDNIAENRNCPKAFSGSSPYRISTKSETAYGTYGKKSICSHM
jgi:hypothetical protein